MIEEGYEIFEWLEIDQDFCDKEYSVTCEASLAIGGTECFNTRGPCQDPANYDPVVPLTLRFCKSQSFLPDDFYYIPTLQQVTIGAGSINPIGVGANSSALGTRGGLSATLKDGPHTDKFVDPYLANRMSRDAGYIATERGTFWTKWRARNPYYVGREIRHCIGRVVGGVVTEVVKRTYFITEINGPNQAGDVTISARDLLSMVANEKAKAPFASNGKLLNDVDDSELVWTLDPVGIGDEEYPASGVVRKGSELCTFTRVGDVLTVVRARFNTTPEGSEAGAVVQLCLQYDSVEPMTPFLDFLNVYAGVPMTYLNTAQWLQEQTDYMPRRYSALITEPTGILDLINEMSYQMYFYPVWDDRNAQLKVRAIRPAQGDPIYELDDFANFNADSVSFRDLVDQQITQAWIFFGIINPAGNVNDQKNYAVREIIATDEGSEHKGRVEKIKQLFCRWISATNGAAAIDLGNKIVARYRRAPRQVTFSLSRKDSVLWLGDFARATHPNSVDVLGAQLPVNIQIMSAQEARAGHVFQYVGQEFAFEQPVDPNQRLIIINTDQENLNLRTLHDSMYAAPVGTETINVYIRSSVRIGGRGAADLELYAGESTYIERRSDGANFNQVLARQLYPVMRRDAVARTFVPRGTIQPFIADGITPNYEQQSDMWIVPCSVAFDTGLWPVGVVINIIQEAGSYVVGEQGYSSVHSELFKQPPFFSHQAQGDCILHASDGGHGLRIRHPVNWTNNGTIGGGGAGGFPGYCSAKQTTLATWYHFGTYPSASGAGFALQGALPTLLGREGVEMPQRTASGGAVDAAGSGSIVDRKMAAPNVRALRLTAGQAGGLAQPSGLPSVVDLGGNPFQPITFYPASYVGGLAGNAIIEGASLITWVLKGDVRGAEVA